MPTHTQSLLEVENPCAVDRFGWVENALCGRSQLQAQQFYSRKWKHSLGLGGALTFLGFATFFGFATFLVVFAAGERFFFGVLTG